MPEHDLIVVSMFADKEGRIYQKGEHITDPAVVEDVLQSNPRAVHKVTKLDQLFPENNPDPGQEPAGN